MTSRELVLNTLAGKNTGRAARQLWYLPWAEMYHKDYVEKIKKDFPDDITAIGCALKEVSPLVQGNAHEIGEFTDDWGCTFVNVQRGIIGEVKQPLVKGEEWEDVGNIHIPTEWLTFDPQEVNANIKKYAPDKFVLAGVCPRPFEQLQFIRGTENLYMDLMYRPDKMMGFIEEMHHFYCELLKKWVKTDIDGIQFMDDWGSQQSLLISPKLWEEIFMPMYRDYIDIAKSAGKKTFMHSDGYTLSIIPKLIDIGLDAFNTQIFCMGVDKVKQFKGKITFWGEIDRQQLIPNGTKQQIEQAVQSVFETLYDNGHAIAQCEFGAGANPENVYHIYETWDKLTKR